MTLCIVSHESLGCCFSLTSSKPAIPVLCKVKLVSFEWSLVALERAEITVAFPHQKEISDGLVKQ